jgi:hypothetical protein
MRSRLRAKLAAAAVVAILAGASLALFAPSGPAVAFSSGGLFLDVQVQSPARLVSRGAAVDVTLEVTCNAPGPFVQVALTQRSGSGLAQGFGSEQVGCTGSGELVVIRARASAGKAFKQGTAVADAEIFGCSADFRVCGSETDSEVIELRR